MIGSLFDSPWKILIVAVVIIVLFGSRKLPDAARSLGRSMRILKTEVEEMHNDDEPAGWVAEAGPAAAPAAPAQLEASTSAQDVQAQFAALQEKVNSLQQTVGTGGTASADSKQPH